MSIDTRTARIYFAAKVRNGPLLKSLIKQHNLKTTSTWLSWKGNRPGAKPDSKAWQSHWLNICQDIEDCTHLIFISLPNERACSGLIELGQAIALGKKIMIVSDDWWSVSNLPAIKVFTKIEDAIKEIQNDRRRNKAIPKRSGDCQNKIHLQHASREVRL
jgi:hypothetical protein